MPFPNELDTSAVVGGNNLPAPGTSLNEDPATSNHPTHSDLHENVGDAVQAVEAKVGTGASTPTTNTVLTGTGSGTSGWATVATAMIADDAVTQAKIADDAVGADQLAASAVVTASIVDDQVTQAKIGPGAVGTTELGADAVNGDKIADDAVAAEHLATNSVTADAIAANAVDTAEIKNDAVTADKIANDAVGNDQLIASPTFTTVTATDITLGGQDLGEIETFTPSYTNTSGFESNQGYYAYVKDLVYVSIETEFSGGVTVGDTRVDLPVAAADIHQASNAMLQVQLFDYDANTYYQGMATPVDSNTIQVRRVAVSGSNLIGGPTSSTLPFTWADGDKILITGFYRVGS